MIDSHAHLGDGAFAEDRAQMLERAGLDAVLDICTDVETLEIGLELKKQFPFVHLVAATTPHDVEKEGESFFPVVEKHVGELVAIGETGLDYYYEHSPRELQQEFLRRYLRLAKRVQLPVVIHCRDAFEDFFRILDEEGPVEGVLHCFTGTLEEACEVVKRGWCLSLSGIVTFKRSEVLREVARDVPLDQLLIETDAPYLAPVPHRGKRNEPGFVRHVAECIAGERGISVDEVSAATAANARRLFQID